MAKTIIQIVLIGLFMFSLIIPIKRLSPTNTYIFNVTYVNGSTRNIVLELPSDFNYMIEDNRGSYSLNLTSPGKTVWCYKSIFPLCEGSVSGVLYVNSITKK